MFGSTIAVRLLCVPKTTITGERNAIKRYGDGSRTKIQMFSKTHLNNRQAKKESRQHPVCIYVMTSSTVNFNPLNSFNTYF